MGAQRVATGIGLAGLAALLASVGLPAVLPPEPVPEIEIVVPVGGSDRVTAPSTQPPPTRTGDDPDDPDDQNETDDGPAGSPDGAPDDDDGDDDGHDSGDDRDDDEDDGGDDGDD
jgi:hypothetical protein